MPPVAHLPAQYQNLVFDRVSRRFGAFEALKGLSLSVKRGEFIALLGPSGCGKTTALNCVAGLLDISDGAILLDDVRVDVLPPEARGFGMVFQNYALFPHMSLEANIGFGLKMRGLPREDIARRVAGALEAVRLTGQGHKLPAQLSGGQQQRVAIARAIVVEPALVLMDEPLSNLDAKLRLDMRGEIRRIHQATEATTLYVTHDQEEALSLADRIVVMRAGQIRQIGTPAALYRAPVALDVADFMGYRNQFAGVLAERTGQYVRVALDGGGVLHARPSENCAGQEGSRLVVAVRPEDVYPCDDAACPKARVMMSEYRGRSYFGHAQTPAGDAVYFAAAHALAEGIHAHFSARAENCIAYDEGAGPWG